MAVEFVVVDDTDDMDRATQTKVAIYVVSFNYALEKVHDCTRIPLQAIKALHKGKSRQVQHLRSWS
jgi:hypothetical protein